MKNVVEASAETRALEDALDHLRTHFQPIVSLADREVIGYEALTRGPEGTAFEQPDLLFDAARHARRVAELDWACQATALRSALDSDLDAPLRVCSSTWSRSRAGFLPSRRASSTRKRASVSTSCAVRP